MTVPMNPKAIDHLPMFMVAPGEMDGLFYIVAAIVLLLVIMAGIVYFIVHAAPEHMAHRAGKAQLQIVSVLALLALFTHNGLYWVAALLLALIPFPDFETPLAKIARAQEQMATRPGPDPGLAAQPNAEAASLAGTEKLP